MPDHRVNQTFSLVNFLLFRAAFTVVSVGVYTCKKLTYVSKLQYLGKTVKCKHNINCLLKESFPQKFSIFSYTELYYKFDLQEI